VVKKPVHVIEDDGFTIKVGEYVDIGTLRMPSYLEITFFGYGEPNSYTRIELRDNIPRIAEISFHSGEKCREVQQKDLRDFDVSYLVNVLYTAAVSDPRKSDWSPEQDDAFNRVVRNFLEERRTGKRVVDTEFLKEVAAVYRANIDHAPTDAVARTFGVKHRQAGSYVSEARRRKLLPQTKQGRAKA